MPGRGGKSPTLGWPSVETTKAIKVAKANCAHTIQDAETCQTVLISKADVWHATHIKEIEDDCTCT